MRPLPPPSTDSRPGAEPRPAFPPAGRARQVSAERRRRRRRTGPALLLAILAAVLFQASSPSPAAPSGAAAKPVPLPPEGIVFTDMYDAAGFRFVHEMSKTEQKYMVETMGSGGGFIDYDLDGDLDVFFQNGQAMPGFKGPKDLHSAFYRSEGGWKYTEATEASGAISRPYGMGMCVGDYDNDGYPDLYAANWGPNVLFHNEGNGTFTDATARAGVGDDGWGSSCAFFDAEGDGDLDLIVVNYVHFTTDKNKFCGDYSKNVRTYCHPNVYEGQPDPFYLNNGDGTFTEAGEAYGFSDRSGNGLGVIVGDYDNDGDPDVFVANDKTPNVLYRNEGGRFEDATLLAGVGYGLDGHLHAGMGVDFGDYDGDGDFDLVVTNLDFENNTLYRNEGNGVFADMSFPAGLGGISLSFVGFGTEFVDYDNNGLLDLFIANGHILDNAMYFNDSTDYAQRNFMHRNKGDGTFEEVGLKLGPDMAKPNVARGLALGDVDDDGDVDFLLTVCGEKPRFFRNDGGNALPMLRVRLVGTASNRNAVGARVTVKAGGRLQMDEVRSGSSYQAQSDFRLHFGLGKAGAADEVVVRWPGGRVDRFEKVAPGSVLLIEGEKDLRR